MDMNTSTEKLLTRKNNNGSTLIKLDDSTLAVSDSVLYGNWLKINQMQEGNIENFVTVYLNKETILLLAEMIQNKEI